MKYFFSALLFFVGFNAHAAKITEVPLSQVKSTTLASVAKQVDELTSRNDYPMFASYSGFAVASTFKYSNRGEQAELTMVRQLMHRSVEQSINSKNLSVREITEAGHPMSMAILDAFMLEFMDEDMSKEYSDLQWAFIEKLSARVVRSKNLALYQVSYYDKGSDDTLGIDGRGIVLLKRDRKEALLIHVQSTENDY